MEKLKNLNILLLEDDLNLKNELSEILSIFFKKVISCEDGSEGLKIFHREIIDVIFTDYVMPTMDGYTFTKKIRELNKEIPIIFLTNYTDKDKLIKLITMNISDFLVKPVNYNDLLKSLKKLNDSIVEVVDTNIIQINKYIIFDKNNKTLNISGKEINLTKNELLLIEILSHNMNSTVSLELLCNSFGNTYKSEQAIKNIVYRLNQKTKVKFLKNIQGIGYKIDNS